MNLLETIEELAARWAELKGQEPRLRIRDAAEKLGTTEGQLLATEVGNTVVRLKPNFEEIFSRLKPLGRVMALTRNQEIVHERKGTYENFEAISGHGKMGLVLGEDIDLRIFFSPWAHAFSVVSEGRTGPMHSLQFFDKHGDAIHKIFLTDQSDKAEFDKLVNDLTSDDQSSGIEVTPREAAKADRPDSEIDADGFRAAWRQLKDTHDFFPMLRKFDVGREQALRIAEREFAYPVPVEAFRTMLQKASERKLPIMVFVGNHGMIQIHTGGIENVLEARGWFNVMDERFNLHIDQSKVASAWVVRKPTDDGIVTSLEIFNDKGKDIALFFGKRKPGIPELEEWRDLIAEIEPKELAARA